MKLRNAIVVIAVFLFGSCVGWVGRTSEVQALRHRLDRSQSLEDLRAQLKQVESQNILPLLKSSASVQAIDEGNLFKRKNVTYLQGSILNTAAVTTAKDVKLKINFFSKTESLITSSEIVLYDFILPSKEYLFKEKIAWPHDAEKFSLQIIDAKTN